MFYVFCDDGMIRHAPFANRVDADHWAQWGHACVSHHRVVPAADAFQVGDILAELLVTDTRAWEVVARTPKGSLTIRSMVEDNDAARIPDERCDKGANGLAVMWVPVKSGPAHSSQRVVRLRKDGTYRAHASGSALKPCARIDGVPCERVDYRF